jgi:3-hydroxybutyryl-CoA dehydrogenase
MPEHPFQQAAVIGTGLMGPGIALSLAIGGLDTVIVSRTAETAEAVRKKAIELLGVLAANGLVEDPTAIEARISGTADFDSAVAAADVVVEAGPENMAFKQALYKRMEAVARPNAVLATTTSGLSINEIASACQHPERVLTAHFWNPPHLMRLVELVRADATSDETVANFRALLDACGKKPVMVKKDRPGQLGNRLQHAMVREALHIVAEGIADPEDVDLAAREGFGLRLPVYGIFDHADAVGLDLVLAIQDYVNPDLCSSDSAPSSVRERVERGDLGIKTGKGFYDWSKRDWDEVRETRDNFILHFLKSDFS